jgi:hypothetical protein
MLSSLNNPNRELILPEGIIGGHSQTNLFCHAIAQLPIGVQIE